MSELVTSCWSLKEELDEAVVRASAAAGGSRELAAGSAFETPYP